MSIQEDREALTAPISNADRSPASSTPNERPSYLPEQFESVEQLARAYTALEKEQQQEQQQQDQQQPEQANGLPTNDTEAAELLDQVNLDFTRYQQEFLETGELSPAAYAELAAVGLDPSVVNSYIAGQQQLANTVRNDVFSVVGGEEKYGEIVWWAKSGMPEADIAAYNAAMGSGDVARMKLATAGLQARYVAENGSSPTLLGGSSGVGANASDVYSSTKELTKDMGSERYRTDPVFRAEVAKRLGRSKIM